MFKDIGVLIIIICILEFTRMISLYLVNRNKEDTEQVVEKACPPHKWDYTETNKMYCKSCYILAGSITSNNGDY